MSAPSNGSVVLHVTPHPDDEALGSPGTLLRMRDAGFRVVVLLVGLGRPSQHERRCAEAVAAAATAGFELVVVDPPIPISSNDDMRLARHRVTSEVRAMLAAYDPAVVVTSSPHDAHHGHEIVAQGTIPAIVERPMPPRLWLWALWGYLPRLTLEVPIDDATLHEAKLVLGAYTGELDRNDYGRLLELRAELHVVRMRHLELRAEHDAILAAEVVHGFGGERARHRYSEMLMECILTSRGWELGRRRTLEPTQEPHGVASGERIGWWLSSESPQKVIAQQMEASGLAGAVGPHSMAAQRSSVGQAG